MTSSTLQDRFIDTNQTVEVEEQKKKRELGNNLLGYIGGTGLEIGAGYATDLATYGMLTAGPIGWAGYGITNFASGAASNWAAQKLRGEEEISWGELISSGLIDIIPFFGQKLKGAKGVANIALQSGARTAAQLQGETALDDQRWLTPRETLEAATIGGVFGTAVAKGLPKGYSALRSRYGKYDLVDADARFPPEAVQEMIKQGRIRSEGKPVDKDFIAYLYKTIDDGVDPSNNDYILSNDRGEIIRNPLLETKKRDNVAAITSINVPEMGNTVLFKNRMRLIRQQMALDVPEASEDLLSLRGSSFIDHHPAPLKTIGAGVDYLNDEGMMLGLNYLQKKIGHRLADFQEGYPAYRKFHGKLHDLLDSKLGSNRNLLGKLQQKYFGDPDALSKGIGVQQRIDSGFYDELAEVILEQEEMIKNFHEVIKNTRFVRGSSYLTEDEYIGIITRQLELDKEFEEITRRLQRSGAKGGQSRGISATSMVNRIVGEAEATSEGLTVWLRGFPPGHPYRVAAEQKLLIRMQNELIYLHNLPVSDVDKGKRFLEWWDNFNLPKINMTSQQIADELIDEAEKTNIEDIPGFQEILDWQGRF